MLLGNTHIEVTLRKALLELHHARTFTHSGCDAYQAFIGLGHVAQPSAKHLREGGFGCDRRLLQTDAGVKLAGAVVGHRVGLSQLVTLTLFGDHVQKLWPLEVADIFQRRDEGVQIVAVNRADVIEAKLLKQSGWHDHALGVLFNALGQFKQGWCAFEHRLAHIFGCCVKLPAHQLRQIAIECSHWRADTHVVIVQDHEKIAVGHPGVIQGFKGHARRHCAVADDGHGMALFALNTGCQGHAQRCRDGGARVGRTKRVVFAFAALREAAQAPELAQGLHAVTPTGQNFVRVSLVAHIPDQPVAGGVEHVVQRHGELHGAQVGTQVAASLGDAVEQIGTQFISQLPQLLARDLAQIRRIIDGVQQGVLGLGHLLSIQ